MVIEHALEKPKPISFPNFTSNYTNTVIEPQKIAQQQAQEAAQQAVVTQPVFYTLAAGQAPTAACDSPMDCIFMHESGNNPAAINASSGACGLAQAYPCSKMPCSLSDYACQVSFFTKYANERYGGWPQAWAYWQVNNNW